MVVVVDRREYLQDLSLSVQNPQVGRRILQESGTTCRSQEQRPGRRCLFLRPLFIVMSDSFGLDFGARLLYCLEKIVSCFKSTD